MLLNPNDHSSSNGTVTSCGSDITDDYIAVRSYQVQGIDYILYSSI